MQSVPKKSIAAETPDTNLRLIQPSVVARPQQPVAIVTPFLSEQQQWQNNYTQTQHPQHYLHTPNPQTPHQHILVPASFLQNARFISPVGTTFMVPSSTSCLITTSPLQRPTRLTSRPVNQSASHHPHECNNTATRMVSQHYPTRPLGNPGALTIRPNYALPMPNIAKLYRFSNTNACIPSPPTPDQEFCQLISSNLQATVSPPPTLKPSCVVGAKQCLVSFGKPVEDITSSPITHVVKTVYEAYQPMEKTVGFEGHLSAVKFVTASAATCGAVLQTAAQITTWVRNDSLVIGLLRRKGKQRSAKCIEQPQHNILSSDAVSISCSLVAECCVTSSTFPQLVDESERIDVKNQKCRNDQVQVEETPVSDQLLTASTLTEQETEDGVLKQKAPNTQFPTPHTYSLFLHNVIPKTPLGRAVPSESQCSDIETLPDLRPSCRLLARIGRGLVLHRYHHYGVEPLRQLRGLKSRAPEPDMQVRMRYMNQMRIGFVEHLTWRPKSLGDFLESGCRRNACTFRSDSFLSLTRHMEQGHCLLASCEGHCRNESAVATSRLANWVPTDWSTIFEKTHPVAFSSIKSSGGGGPKYRCPYCAKLFATVKAIQTHAVKEHDVANLPHTELTLNLTCSGCGALTDRNQRLPVCNPTAPLLSSDPARSINAHALAGFLLFPTPQSAFCLPETIAARLTASSASDSLVHRYACAISSIFGHIFPSDTSATAIFKDVDEIDEQQVCRLEPLIQQCLSEYLEVSVTSKTTPDAKTAAPRRRKTRLVPLDHDHSLVASWRQRESNTSEISQSAHPKLAPKPAKAKIIHLSSRKRPYFTPPSKQPNLQTSPPVNAEVSGTQTGTFQEPSFSIPHQLDMAQRLYNPSFSLVKSSLVRHPTLERCKTTLHALPPGLPQTVNLQNCAMFSQSSFQALTVAGQQQQQQQQQAISLHLIPQSRFLAGVTGQRLTQNSVSRLAPYPSPPAKRIRMDHAQPSSSSSATVQPVYSQPLPVPGQVAPPNPRPSVSMQPRMIYRPNQSIAPRPSPPVIPSHNRPISMLTNQALIICPMCDFASPDRAAIMQHIGEVH